MKQNFKIVDEIYLVKDDYRHDLHNNFDFSGFDYSIEKRELVLRWKRSMGEWVSTDTPTELTIKFEEVSEFRFMPRDSEKPFTEDDCLNTFGYWVEEDWVKGVIIVGPDREADPQWLTAIDFMSGAVLAVQADSGSATVLP